MIENNEIPFNNMTMQNTMRNEKKKHLLHPLHEPGTPSTFSRAVCSTFSGVVCAMRGATRSDSHSATYGEEGVGLVGECDGILGLAERTLEHVALALQLLHRARGCGDAMGGTGVTRGNGHTARRSHGTTGTRRGGQTGQQPHGEAVKREGGQTGQQSHGEAVKRGGGDRWARTHRLPRSRRYCVWRP